MVLSGGGNHSKNFYGVIDNGFSLIISLEDLFNAWKKFSKGKRSNPDVAKFELNLESNLFKIHEELLLKTWEPQPYIVFYIQDPKLRQIHKADVRDRVLYQAVYEKLNRVLDKTFIHDSYSSRDYKGTHKGVKRFEEFSRKATDNYNNSAFVLKCDVKKFFDSIDHEILIKLIREKFPDSSFLELIIKIIDSFEISPGKGLPLGNVTSQIFANIYLNELDQFVKHILKAKYYIRYCDDFLIIESSREKLELYTRQLSNFLENYLLLNLHPQKVSIRKIIQGTDFLGYVSLPHYRVIRTSTKNRLLKRISFTNMASYWGILMYCKGERLKAIALARLKNN